MNFFETAEYNADFRGALDQARNEALTFGHGHVDTTHLLLAILRQPSDRLIRFLRSFEADASSLAREAASVLKDHEAPPITALGYPYTPRAREALQSALFEAQELRHAEVGPEHLLVGLLKAATPSDMRILNTAGVTLGKAHTELTHLYPTSAVRKRARWWGLSLALSAWFAFPVAILALLLATIALIVALRK